eukprot:TRINITY_DN45492_c0_g1_i1.p1 TRINITY_DN45492_c0_g1~~TRINITY_DN45492_c0_g1_i1.p1  ORF type:complete len:470 (+),score=123.30 TRINITY_DN45492_c0_g1_i1:179-1588(+)
MASSVEPAPIWRSSVGALDDDDDEGGEPAEPGSPAEDDCEGSDDGRGLLGASLAGDALAQALIDTHTSNELGLVRSEVRRLRAKIDLLEREKDDMVDNFRCTTQVLINRIKELEGELSVSKSRPQTAAVLDRIENRAAGRPPLPSRGGSRGSSRGSGGSGGLGQSAPDVLRIDEDAPLEPCVAATASSASLDAAGGAAADGAVAAEGGDDEGSVCGNCGKVIPGGNLVSHSIYCYRNSWRCTSCNEVFPLRDKEAHMAEWTNSARLVDAVRRRAVEEVQCMVEHGADPCSAVEPQTEDAPLHAAARRGDAELIALCISYGCDPNPVNARNEQPLHLAVESGDFSTVKLLVEVGADVNTANGQGDQPLMLACRRGSAEAARLLLEVRADAGAATVLGDTPVQVAARMGHQATVLALTSAGAPLRSGTPRRMRSASPMHGLAGSGGCGGGGYPLPLREASPASSSGRVKRR